MPADYLEMPSEQGSMRFGPLPDVVRIGSDPHGCDVILAPRTGVPMWALELRRTSGGSWSVHFPSQTPHPCQLLSEGVVPGHGRAIRDGARMQPGETIMISGMTVHPRFQLVRSGLQGLAPVPVDGGVHPGLPRDPNAPPEVESTRRGWWPFRRAPAIAAPALPNRGAAGYGGALAVEARRQATSRMLARVPLLRNLRDVFWRFRKGGMSEPMMAVTLAIGVVGAISAGGISLMGILYLLGK